MRAHLLMNLYLFFTKMKANKIDNNTLKRNFILGEEWIYYKLYSGTKTADRILMEAIKPVIDYLLRKKKIDRWFFIRYADPDFHLRIRLHCTKITYVGSIIQRIYKAIGKFVDQELIWKVQTDTYQREIERYGINNMELSEQLFFVDSEMHLKILPLLKSEQGKTQRWMIALKMADYLLDAFQYDMPDKLRLFKTLSDDFGKEFGMNRFLKSQLDAKFQKERKNIENSLYSVMEHNSIITIFLEMLKTYKDSIRTIATDIYKLNGGSQKEILLDVIVSSYIHMTMNRMFKSRQRIHEMVLYDFLFRYYRSMIARLKANEKN